ncbi:MAG TPA: phosphopantothenoylcysteine decarboxylase, partial [Thermomicrobiales bacterium]|nr:phosphopantothenoylcysteine decarboxylase [Thermomicrobiales bacterium]
LASVDRVGLIKVGFAAETDDLIENATGKLRAKGLSMIVANDAVATIGSEESQATLLFADGASESLPPMAKSDLARLLVDRVVRLVEGRGDA